MEITLEGHKDASVQVDATHASILLVVTSKVGTRPGDEGVSVHAAIATTALERLDRAGVDNGINAANRGGAGGKQHVLAAVKVSVEGILGVGISLEAADGPTIEFEAARCSWSSACDPSVPMRTRQ